MKDRYLLASAPTKEDLLVSIIKFYGGTVMTILDDGTIQRVSDNKICEGVFVVQKKNRWRFEMKKGD